DRTNLVWEHPRTWTAASARRQNADLGMRMSIYPPPDRDGLAPRRNRIQPGNDRPDRSPHQHKDAEQVGIGATGALAFRERSAVSPMIGSAAPTSLAVPSPSRRLGDIFRIART